MTRELVAAPPRRRTLGATRQFQAPFYKVVTGTTSHFLAKTTELKATPAVLQSLHWLPIQSVCVHRHHVEHTHLHCMGCLILRLD